MAGATSSNNRSTHDAPPLMLGGPVALAESEWMGVAQASDVLEPLGVAAIPIAFAVTATVETVALGIVLLIRMRYRMNASATVAP